MYNIYILFSSLEPTNIRYIGYTKKQLKVRLREHISESKDLSSYKHKWIQKQLREGGKIEIILLETVFNHTQAKNREIELIKVYKGLGSKLVNGTDGVSGFKQTESQKSANALRKAKQIYYFSYDTKVLLGSFSSMTETVKTLNLTKSCFQKVVSGKSNQHKGYVFSFDRTYPEKTKKSRTSWNAGLKTRGLQKFNTRKVKIYKENNEYTFDFTYQASDFLGINRVQMYRYIKSGKLYNGWKIINV